MAEGSGSGLCLGFRWNFKNLIRPKTKKVCPISIPVYLFTSTHTETLTFLYSLWVSLCSPLLISEAYHLHQAGGILYRTADSCWKIIKLNKSLKIMADVMVMKEIEETAERLGIDLSRIDLDSIRLPPGEDFGIKR